MSEDEGKREGFAVRDNRNYPRSGELTPSKLMRVTRPKRRKASPKNPKASKKAPKVTLQEPPKETQESGLQKQNPTDYFQGFPNPADSIPKYDQFFFEETPKHRNKLTALVANTLSQAIIDDREACEGLVTEARNRAAKYFVETAMDDTLSPSNWTKNFSLQYLFEMATSLTPTSLRDSLEFGKDVTADSLLSISASVNKTYGRFAESLYVKGLGTAFDDEEGKKTLVERVKEWNLEFRLGVKPSDLEDKDKLIDLYAMGKGKEKAYLDAQKVDIMTP